MNTPPMMNNCCCYYYYYQYTTVNSSTIYYEDTNLGIKNEVENRIHQSIQIPIDSKQKQFCLMPIQYGWRQAKNIPLH